VSTEFKPYAIGIILVFILSGVWFHVVGYSTSFTVQADLVPNLPLERLLYFAAMILGFIICAIGDYRVQRSFNYLLVISTAMLVMGTGMFVLAAYQSLMPQQLFASIGGVLMGVSYAWFLLNCFRMLAAKGNAWDVALVSIIACTASIILLIPINFFLTAQLQATLVIVISLLMGLLLFLVDRKVFQDDRPFVQTAIQTDEDQPSDFRTAVLRYSNQGIYLLFVAVAVIALRGIGAGGLWGDSREVTIGSGSGSLLMVSTAIALYLAVSLPIFYAYAHRAGRFLQTLPVLCLITGLFLLVILDKGGISPQWYSSLSLSLEWYCQSVFNLILILNVRSLPCSMYRLGGIIWAFTFLLGTTWLILFKSTSIEASLIVLVVIYLLVLATALFRPQPQLDFAEKQGAGSLPGTEAESRDSIENRCRELAIAKGLTRREREVLLLLAQGRSLPVVQRELTLANGTVRTHTRHIYEKIGVHTRQELLDILANR
jgi:DNA-binding CsgD family transcriptional regulator